MQKFVVACVLLTLAAAPARADRSVTIGERTKLQTILSAKGCSGGAMAFAGGVYKVDGALCNDGRTYEMIFDTSLTLMQRRLRR
jgi:hypothetical protein